uniref:Uncharacterized protein n=1 Tax=Pseudo-nitzschia australis TaxID=44445 RepID=A0A7S4EPX1_9STRA|mmetsp:Transcript_19957/g.43390  ORF Transcript_19957/g.43390 Transcript_19957/m.43390 type:complete len:465 (-) Transcript_19957:193-1587(-)
MKILALGIVCLHASATCFAFQSTDICTVGRATKAFGTSIFISNGYTCGLRKYRRFYPFTQMSKNGDDDSDEYIEDADLGDWRSFRKTLVDQGISYDTTEDGYLDTDAEKSETPTISNTGSSTDRPKSVSKANEELLEKQSETLAKEYKDGVWAHEASFAEIGGLVVRMPLEAEIYKNKDKLIIGKELTTRLQNNEDVSKKNLDEPILPIAAQTLNWYQQAQVLIQEEMVVIAGSANEKGEVDPTRLPAKTEDLLRLYLNNQENWQSVCLVAEKDESDGSAVTYTLNRPLTFSLTENMAKMVFFGAMSNLITDGRIPISKTNQYSKFVRAFEKECAIYIGGSNKQDKPAVIIHGISNLEGATEISSGTGVYMGGLDAAIDGVLDGRYKPLDFRFFIGCNSYQKGGLDAAIISNQYQPIACARSLALKQCIQLPKPLWHEVMEMCGGELMEVSRLELKKRSDINPE